MTIKWLSNKKARGSVSIYHSNLTFNTVASLHLTQAYRIRVGLDGDDVLFEPLSKERVLRGDLDEETLFEVKRKPSYSRISNTNLSSSLSEILCLDLSKEPVKKNVYWDEGRKCLIINGKEE